MDVSAGRLIYYLTDYTFEKYFGPYPTAYFTALPAGVFFQQRPGNPHFVEFIQHSPGSKYASSHLAYVFDETKQWKTPQAGITLMMGSMNTLDWKVVPQSEVETALGAKPKFSAAFATEAEADTARANSNTLKIETWENSLSKTFTDKWEDEDWLYTRWADGTVTKEENKSFLSKAVDQIQAVGKVLVQGAVGYASLPIGGAYGLLANTGEGQKAVGKLDSVTGGVASTLTKPGATAAKFATEGEVSMQEIKDALSAGAKIAAGSVAVGGSVAAVASGAPSLSTIGTVGSVVTTFNNADPVKLALSQQKEFTDNIGFLPKGENVDIFGVNVDKYIADAQTTKLSSIGAYISAVPSEVSKVSVNTALSAAGNLTAGQVAQGVKSVGAVASPQNTNSPGFVESIQSLAGQSPIAATVGGGMGILLIVGAIYFLTRK